MLCRFRSIKEIQNPPKARALSLKQLFLLFYTTMHYQNVQEKSGAARIGN